CAIAPPGYYYASGYYFQYFEFW
nr:immunoglobulin heavy chain junction region [Macaca mulatta]MOW98622.1 immunoglobulin heavy chain junction region [Macaca mulatta]MOX02948.1 immunoglobulin heavy chain junction region [Macaca mulatta]MOX02982.1 immunoglobulin heavy chain junction region [Macaca mulatta]MOX03179.1 immunoglobulin heavy chain junction region [Macaca mulatta]